MRHEASGQQVEVSLTGNGMALHHHGRLARRDVPTWCHVRGRVPCASIAPLPMGAAKSARLAPKGPADPRAYG